MRKQSKYFLIFFLIFLFFFLSRSYIHLNLKTEFYDEYFHDNSLWNTAQGRPFYDTVNNTSFLGGHFSPILLVFSLPYLIAPSPFWMFAFQALFVAGIITLLFSFAQNNLPPPQANLILFLLLTSVPFRCMGINDFHMDIVVAFLLASALYVLFTKNNLLLPAFLLLSGFLVKETTGPLLTSFGLYLLLFRKEKAIGFMLILSGFAGTIFIMKEIIPKFNPGGVYMFSNYYSHFGANVHEQLLNMARNPLTTIGAIATGQNLLYLFLLFAPLGFLPFYYLPILTVGFLPLMLNLLSSYRFQKDITVQYQYVIVIVLFYAAILGIKSLRITNRWEIIKERVKPIIVFFAVLSLLSFFVLQLRYYIPSEKIFSAHRIMHSIPKDASVSASSHLLLHLQYREHLALFPEIKNSDYVIFEDIDWWLFHEKGDDFIKMKKLWGQKKYGNIFSYLLMGISNPDSQYAQAIINLKKNIRYKLIASENGIYLYKRAAKAKILCSKKST